MIIDDFKNMFSEFDTSLVDEQLPNCILTYKNLYNVEYDVSEIENNKILYLLAHLLYVNNKSSYMLATSKSDDGVSISYVVPTNLNEQVIFYMSSKYGAMFYNMISTRIGAKFV